MSKAPTVKIVKPDSFDPPKHFYPRVLNATQHPLVTYFMNMKTSNIVKRYCHLNPNVDVQALTKLLTTQPKYFHWCGSDLFSVTSSSGHRKMLVIETNSCPSGQKSMPTATESDDTGGYARLVRVTFKELLEKDPPEIEGALAVIYDKNSVEASGYAAVIADEMQEQVYLAEFPDLENDVFKMHEPKVKFVDDVCHVNHDGKWIPIRAAFRYVTQRPWNRLPVNSKTRLLNPVSVCLAGGRNKLVAAKAYDLLNSSLAGTGLAINTPETLRDLSKEEVPIWVKSMGGRAVVKNPYSNAGQGVYTITTESELQAFMDSDEAYDKYIVQSLIGNSTWSSTTANEAYYHVGTMPNKAGKTYAVDLRMMVMATKTGYRPVAMYSRRALEPLSEEYHPDQDTWSMLGTNLSIKMENGKWDTDTNRLILLDRKDFNTLGLGVDDLIACYVQTVLACTAIDQMVSNLMENGSFDFQLFASLDNDSELLKEIVQGSPEFATKEDDEEEE